MSDASLPEPAVAAVAETVARLTDGEWHRLHPASPLLKGGIALIAILGIIIANLRERLIGLFLPYYGAQGDPVNYIVDNGYVVQALLIVGGLLLLFIAGFYVSWRMHSFRITDEVVEVRSGVLFRTNRKARLDRIQGINVVRPFFARLFGAAKLEISQAGHDANVQLSYLASGATDDLRREILRRASGTRAREEAAASGVSAPAQNVIDRRMDEFLAPELDQNAAAPESVVTIHLGRLVGSIILSGSTVFALLLIIGAIVWISTSGEYYVLFFVLPSIIGFGSYYVRRFTKSLRYTIAGTPDGVRVGFGLLSTSNETLPPGRIHSIEVSQPLLWRPARWWQIRVNRASRTSNRGAENQANTTILPVGNRADVTKVLELMLPDFIGPEAVAFIETGLVSKGNDGFTNSPKRAAWLRPVSWRRNGFRIVPGSIVLRKGAIWRRLIIVPQPRLQSVAVRQGPLLRLLRLADIHLHTVAGPISAELSALDQDAAVVFFGEVAEVAVRAGDSDTSHRWRSGEAA
ncbi:PH domain-containing protein [Glaciihabitans sp. UYNi722]|uniref:PH domain-containing protein n=1 Tax=Glaciihabitans sp. UYNi722 TaxID=3156344 RepID=UPI0033934DFE